jgi:magnesium chelatase family protein
MVGTVKSFAFQGLDAIPIEVQGHLAPGLPSFALVGLPDKAVGESRERVRAALQSIGMALPPKRITVNLSPANILKEGSHYDLPVALALLVATGVLEASMLEGYAAMGELSLDGRLLPVPGVLPAAIAAQSREWGLICPEASGAEAKWAGEELSVLAPSSLLHFINHCKGLQSLPVPELRTRSTPQPHRDMSEVRGQEVARRALEIAASGGHNMLMAGPPGSGKSLLAACLPGLLPPMDRLEMLETSMIASIAGTLTDGVLTRTRPYRAPHHTSSPAAMVGGGRRAQPGEISLAHHGVLFLDELPEFPRAVLEALRQPLETREVSVARVQAHVTYPADFQLVAAMNPCRCGYLGDSNQECSKAPSCGDEYQGKLSGPLLDRIDIHVAVPAVSTLEIFDLPAGEPTAIVAARVAEVRTMQRARYAPLGDVKIRTNADLDGDHLTRFATPEAAGMDMLRTATEKFGLSMRAFNRVLRLSRTIADMAGSDAVRAEHVGEALSYRQMRYRLHA